MKLLSALAVSVVLCAGRAAYADCSYPPAPDHIPDGNTATMQEMVAGQKAVKEYDKAINAYVACLQLEHDSAVSDAVKQAGGNKDKLSKEQKDSLARDEAVEVQKHNAAIDQLQGVANRFNEQVRVFKAKSNPDAAKK
jgi:hypothetical protein